MDTILIVINLLELFTNIFLKLFDSYQTIKEEHGFKHDIDAKAKATERIEQKLCIDVILNWK